jgi:hypothetical protein
MGARKRTIDPSIWSDEGFMQLSDGAQLFFIGLISNADDEGRGSAVPKTLGARIFPSEGAERITAIAGYKAEVAEHTHTVFYEAEGSDYYALLKWHDWQRVDHPQPSAIPAPSMARQAGSFRPAPEVEELFDKVADA